MLGLVRCVLGWSHSSQIPLAWVVLPWINQLIRMNWTESEESIWFKCCSTYLCLSQMASMSGIRVPNKWQPDPASFSNYSIRMNCSIPHGWLQLVSTQFQLIPSKGSFARISNYLLYFNFPAFQFKNELLGVSWKEGFLGWGAHTTRVHHPIRGRKKCLLLLA